MPTIKKTLITKLSLDVTGMSDEQIEAIAQFHRVTFAPVGFKDIAFEIAQQNEEDTFAKWMQSIRNEFMANDVPAEKSDEQQRPRD